MSWLYSQALVEEYLVGNFSDGEQFVLLNGNPTQQAYCAPDKMTDFSRLSRFGMTYKPLTESRGEELLMSFRAGFHAKTSPRRGGGGGLMAKDQECGITWHGWLAKYDPDSCSWKTPQCSLLGEEQESLEILPKWGMTVNGLLWEQQTLEPITSETEFGLLPTPVRSDYKGTSKNSKFDNRARQYKAWDDGTEASTLYPNPLAYEVLMGWPLGWTDLKPLVMDKSLCVQQQLGDC
jgi:hypothetical protein